MATRRDVLRRIHAWVDGELPTGDLLAWLASPGATAGPSTEDPAVGWLVGAVEDLATEAHWGVRPEHQAREIAGAHLFDYWARRRAGAPLAGGPGDAGNRPS